MGTWNRNSHGSWLQHSSNLGTSLNMGPVSVKWDNSKDSLLGLLRRLIQVITKTIMCKAENSVQVLVSYCLYYVP